MVSQGNLEILLLLALNYGDLIMFFSCFLYSGFTLGLRKKPNIDPFVLMFFFSITALIGSFPGILIENHLNLINWPNNKNDFLIIKQEHENKTTVIWPIAKTPRERTLLYCCRRFGCEIRKAYFKRIGGRHKPMVLNIQDCVPYRY